MSLSYGSGCSVVSKTVLVLTSFRECSYKQLKLTENSLCLLLAAELIGAWETLELGNAYNDLITIFPLVQYKFAIIEREVEYKD